MNQIVCAIDQQKEEDAVVPSNSSDCWVELHYQMLWMELLDVKPLKSKYFELLQELLLVLAVVQ